MPCFAAFGHAASRHMTSVARTHNASAVFDRSRSSLGSRGLTPVAMK